MCIAKPAVCYLNVSLSSLITSVWVDRAGVSAIDVVSIQMSSSSSGRLGNAVLFYCGTPCAFHIISFFKKKIRVYVLESA